MSTSDAILVGEGWISEHYFTTDTTKQSFQARVLERRKAWDAEEKQGQPSPRAAFTRARGDLVATLARLGAALTGDEATDATRPDASELNALVRDTLIGVLGLTGHGLRHDRDGPIVRVVVPDISEQVPLVLILAEPLATVEELIGKDAPTLREPVAVDGDAEGPEYPSAARLLSALFVADRPPEFALVLSGRWALLAERARWAEGRYLAIDVQAVAERNDTRRGREIDRMLTCLCAESIAPDADGDIWWRGVLDESVKHTVGVSQDLRDGVRLSIEIIANEVVKRRAAQGLDPLPQTEAQPLAVQALRFLYRILFLLYAEASPELGVLPAGAQEYDQGYSLDRLRELVQVELATPQSQTGTHLYDSLAVLFRLVDRGHLAPTDPTHDTTNGGGADDGTALPAGLEFHALRADLFRPLATAHIDAVGLGNAAVQRVLRHLLLSKEKRGRDRGFISYAELGINQLGAVYEGLMSYTGFFATEDLYEVAKGGDASKGSWVVPADRIEGIAPVDFVMEPGPNGEQRPVLHQRGTFVFRLAGRERQQSASYYTPEVLTRFTIGQALEELLDQDGHTTTAAEILDMTVCEPALGSGAFAIEAVRQLATQYLDRRQAELGRRIDPDDYPRRLAEVKAYLALHNVYGVDLNATAVELAEISLWLDTMVEGLQAPWFGLHLRRGNSLIGARRAIYSRKDVSDKSWLKAVPREVALTSLVTDLDKGAIGGGLERGIHHFLLPAAGWGAAADAKEAVKLAPEATRALKDWRRSIKAKPTKKQLDDLSELAHRVEVLWQFAYARLRIAEDEARRSIPVWAAGELRAGGAVQREQIEAALADADGAYQRLRRVMDAWCALWFWPLTETVTTVDGPTGSQRAQPPSLAEWIVALQALLGRSPEVRSKARPPGNQTFGSATAWDELGQAETTELSWSAAQPVGTVLREHPWLAVCERVAQQQGFHHWELDFATVFARGGFDLQVGNPPWVRPDWDESAALAEFDPRWELNGKIAQATAMRMREATLALQEARDLYIDTETTAVATRAKVSSVAEYPYLEGLRPDLYRCFMEQAWRHASAYGASGLIHPETHFTDEKAGFLRQATYLRLRRHWQFINELKLFERDNHVVYGVHIYSGERPSPRFLMASSLYHPDTVVRSFDHDGSGQEPGLKDPDGNWDQRPHRSRVITVDDSVLATWHAALEDPDVPVRRTRMVHAVNRSVAAVLGKLTRAPRMGELGLQFAQGWNETTDFKKGFFETDWGEPDSWNDVILQGPHLHVATPIYKTPNKTMRSQNDWSATDVELLAPNALPVTSYKPVGDRAKYDAAYTHWTGPDGTVTSARDHYRIAWRSMAVSTNERTLMPALIPEGAAHVSQSVYAAGFADRQGSTLAVCAGGMASLLADLNVRTSPKSAILHSVIARLPNLVGTAIMPMILLRTLRLNCVTNAFSNLWQECHDPAWEKDRWAGGVAYPNRERLEAILPIWTPATPLRRDSDRRQALVEIDALVALTLGVTADELCTIYRTQFAVLYGYDHSRYCYDANGRLVPNSVLTVWRKKGDAMSEEERTATNQAGNTYTYELPFVTLDREADMRTAYAEFERRLADRS